MNSQVLYGPRFAILLPEGYTWLPQMRPANMFGAMQQTGFWLLPPGATMQPIYPGVVFIEAIAPQFVQELGNMLYNFENPMVAGFSAMTLGVQDIRNVGTVRQTDLPSGRAHIREFEATSFPPMCQPMHFMVMMLEGALVTVEVIIGINLLRWAEYMGPFLNIIAGANLAGGQPVESEIYAKIDPNNASHVELTIGGPDDKVSPMTIMPAIVNSTTVVNTAKLEGVVRQQNSTAGPGEDESLNGAMSALAGKFGKSFLTDANAHIAGVNVYIGEIKVGDNYQAGQAGAMGPQAHAENMSFNQRSQQAQDSIDLPTLANELAKLRAAIKSDASAPDAAATDVAAGTLAQAEQAAKGGDRQKVFEQLKQVGKWVLDVGTKIGAEVAVKAIESAIGV